MSKLIFKKTTCIDIKWLTLKQGGCSIQPYYGGKTPEGGYMVALQGHERIISVENFTSIEVVKYLEEHSKLLMENPHLYLGTWVNEGKVYLDLSENVQDLSVALQRGKERNQLAIFNISTFEEVAVC